MLTGLDNSSILPVGFCVSKYGSTHWLVGPLVFTTGITSATADFGKVLIALAIRLSVVSPSGKLNTAFAPF